MAASGGWCLLLLLALLAQGRQTRAADDADVDAADCGPCSCADGVLDCSAQVLPPVGLWPHCACANSSNLTAIFRASGLKVLYRLPMRPGVVSLSLRHNQMQEIQDGAFVDLPSLLHLDLSHNRLEVEDISPTVLRGAYSPVRYEPMALQSLDVSYNLLHSLDARAFEHLPELKVLRLDYNPLKVIDTNTMMALGSPPLQELGLSGCQLSTVPHRVLVQLAKRRSLRTLYLTDNNLTAVPQGLEMLGPTLEELNLSANQLEELDDESLLGEWPRMRSLSLSAMPRMRRLGPRSLSPLAALEELVCAHNHQLAEIHALATRGLDRLRKVRLDNSYLEQLGVDSLPWSSLEQLELEGNPWRCDCHALQWLTPEARAAISDYPTCVSPARMHHAALGAVNVSVLCATESGRRRLGPRRGRLGAAQALLLASAVFGAIACAAYLVHRIRTKRRSAPAAEAVYFVNVRYTQLANSLPHTGVVM